MSDIAFARCKLLRYTSNPRTFNWKAIGRVLGYLKRTINLVLMIINPQLIGFSIGGGAISWAFKKQIYISHSTMESEFITLVATGEKVE